MLFRSIFLCKFDGYIYEQVCDDFEDLRKFEGESLIDFTIRFRLTCLKFKIEDKPSKNELLDWFEYIFSLPLIPNPYEISSSFVLPPSNINENSNVDVKINYD